MRSSRSLTLAALALAVLASARPASAVPESAFDTSFGTGGVVRIDVGIGTTDALRAVAVDNSGRIVAVGSSDDDAVVLRLRSDGSIDGTFGTGGIVTIEGAAANAVGILGDDSIVVVGTSSGDVLVARYCPSGALDAGFGVGGLVTTDVGSGTADEGLAAALRSDGRIVVAGRSANDLALLQYRTDGSLDPTFGTGGIAGTAAASIGGGETSATGRAVAVEADGRILVAGDASGDTALLLRYSATGTEETTRLFGGNASPTAFRSLTLDGDRVLVVGDFSTVPGTTFGLVVRYTASLALDPGLAGDGDYTVSSGGSPTRFLSSAVQEDGRFLVGGSDATDQLILNRYLTDGDGDDGFGAAGSFIGLKTAPADRAAAIALQPDGEIVVAGTQADDLLVARIVGTSVEATPRAPSAPTGACAPSTTSATVPSYDASILTAPAPGTARLTRPDSTFALPGTSAAAGQVTYVHDGLTATLRGTRTTSAARGLVGDGRGEVVVELTGDLVPDGVIEAWIASTPRLAAAHRITADGVQRFAVPLGAPLDGEGPIETGAHVLQLVLPTASGRQVLDVNLDVRTADGLVPSAVPAGAGPAIPTPLNGVGVVLAAMVVASRAGTFRRRERRG